MRVPGAAGHGEAVARAVRAAVPLHVRVQAGGVPRGRAAHRPHRPSIGPYGTFTYIDRDIA